MIGTTNNSGAVAQVHRRRSAALAGLGSAMRKRGKESELKRRAWATYERGEMRQALPLFLELAASGKPYYLVVAARMYMDGEGTVPDTARSEELLNEAGALGVREAVLQRAALVALRGDDREYFRLVSQAERDGLLPAKYLLALCYLNGRGTARDIEKSMTLMRGAASEGHLGARAVLARQFVKHPASAFDFIRGVGLFVTTSILMVVLAVTNPHDERLR